MATSASQNIIQQQQIAADRRSLNKSDKVFLGPETIAPEPRFHCRGCNRMFRKQALERHEGNCVQREQEHAVRHVIPFDSMRKRIISEEQLLDFAFKHRNDFLKNISNKKSPSKNAAQAAGGISRRPLGQRASGNANILPQLSQKASALIAAGAGAVPAVQPQLIRCSQCNRSFESGRIAIHEGICKKRRARAARPKFDSVMKRWNDEYRTAVIKSKEANAKKSSVLSALSNLIQPRRRDWRKESAQLRQAIRDASDQKGSRPKSWVVRLPKKQLRKISPNQLQQQLPASAQKAAVAAPPAAAVPVSLEQQQAPRQSPLKLHHAHVDPLQEHGVAVHLPWKAQSACWRQFLALQRQKKLLRKGQ